MDLYPHSLQPGDVLANGDVVVSVTERRRPYQPDQYDLLLDRKGTQRGVTANWTRLFKGVTR
jgi:hypothetical protein